MWKHETYSMDNLAIRDFLFAGAEADTIVNGMSDAHWKGNGLKNYYLTLNPTLRCNTLFDTGSDFINSPYTMDSTLLNQAMSQGTHIMHMDCHGASLYWQLTKIFSSNIYAVENTLGLYRNSPAVIFTDACHVNDFSHSSFLGKAFLRSGANTIGFLGCSSFDIGYKGIDYSQDVGIDVSKRIIDYALAIEGGYYYSLGIGYRNMKINIISNQSKSPSDSYFWLFFSYNMLGDPDAKLYYKQPCNTGTPRTYANKEIFTIKNDTSRYFTVVRENGSYNSVYKPSATGPGLIEFDRFTDDRTIGYFNEKSFLHFIRPQYDTDFYLYNTSINNSETYKYRNIHIGKKPDNTISTETVTIQSGANQEFIYTGELNIYRSFTCEQGAELIIRPTNE